MNTFKTIAIACALTFFSSVFSQNKFEGELNIQFKDRDNKLHTAVVHVSGDNYLIKLNDARANKHESYYLNSQNDSVIVYKKTDKMRGFICSYSTLLYVYEGSDYVKHFSKLQNINPQRTGEKKVENNLIYNEFKLADKKIWAVEFSNDFSKVIQLLRLANNWNDLNMSNALITDGSDTRGSVSVKITPQKITQSSFKSSKEVELVNLNAMTHTMKGNKELPKLLHAFLGF